MFSKILAIVFIAFALYSTNTISITPVDGVERSTKFSANHHAAAQLAALEE